MAAIRNQDTTEANPEAAFVAAPATASLVSSTFPGGPLEEARNDNTEAAATVDSGHIALFDVWWNDEEGELTNTSCPPTVEYVSAGRAGTKENRSPSNIDIAKTVIHIPNSAKIDLNADNNPYTLEKYPELWAADALEDRDPDNDDTTDPVGDGIVWALPACPPDGTPASPEDGGLCLSFSTALLNNSGTDWVDLTVDDEGNVSGGIEYHIDHVHQIDIDKQDPRYTLAYEEPAAGATGANAALWNSANARIAVMPVAAGEYERPMWFFADRGTYELQVHIRGNPNLPPAPQVSGPEPIAIEQSVTSDMREYTIHVGAEADLSVGVTAAETECSESSPTVATPLEPGDCVTITVTASNVGREKAPNTKVDVSLPSGLKPPVDGEPYPYEATKGTYEDGVWTIGSMCNPTEPAKPSSNPPEPECPQAATLTITAKVAEGTRGETLKVKATISATETLHIKEIARDENGEPRKDTETGQYILVDQAYPVPVPDPVSGNDMDMDSVTVLSIPNEDPTLEIMCSVIEFSKPKTKVCDPVKVKDPDDTNDMSKYALVGEDAEHFDAQHVEGGAQIVVALGAVIDHEERDSYELTLTVSDGKDEHGNDDSRKRSAVDDSIDVTINVLEFKVTLVADDETPRVGEDVTFTITLENPPVPVSELSYIWGTKDPDYPNEGYEGSGGDGNPGTITVRSNTEETLVYRIQFYYLVGTEEVGMTDSKEITVTWSNSNN